MKIRTGFVSNSSASSFLMYGVYVSDKPNITELYDDLYEECQDLKIDFELAYAGEYRYVGRSLKKIKDEQTFREFKEETRKIVQALLSKHDINVEDGEFGIYEEAWRDG